MRKGGTVLIVGSGPEAVRARRWDRAGFDTIVAINNAWRVRPDWDVLIHPDNFPPDRWPERLSPGQRTVRADAYIPSQNAYGGIVYAGGTMAFTASYWALHALRPRVMAFIGCDMVYASKGPTHFYGTGTADPLREDITLQSLEAKSARVWLMAARDGTACVNLSTGPSRLVFPRASATALAALPGAGVDARTLAPALELEAELGYAAPDGRYWKRVAEYDPEALAAVDRLWLQAFSAAQSRRAA